MKIIRTFFTFLLIGLILTCCKNKVETRYLDSWDAGVLVNNGKLCVGSPLEIPISIMPSRKQSSAVPITDFCVFEKSGISENFKCVSGGIGACQVSRVKSFNLKDRADGLKQLEVHYVFSNNETRSVNRLVKLDTVLPTISKLESVGLSTEGYQSKDQKIEFSYRAADNSGGCGLHEKPYRLYYQKRGHGKLLPISDWISEEEHGWSWPFEKELFVRAKVILLVRDKAGNTITGAIELNNNEYETIAGKDWNGDFGTATVAKLNEPAAVAMHAGGTLCFNDSKSFRIRCVGSFESGQKGIIRTIIGNGIRASLAPDGSPAINVGLDSGITHLQFFGDDLYYIEARSYLRKVSLTFSEDGRLIDTGAVSTVVSLRDITLRCERYGISGNGFAGCEPGGTTEVITLQAESFLVTHDPESMNFTKDYIYFATPQHALIRYRKSDQSFELLAGNFKQTGASHGYGAGAGAGPDTPMAIDGDFELSLPIHLARGPGETLFVTTETNWQDTEKGYDNILRIDLTEGTAISVSFTGMRWLRGVHYLQGGQGKGKLVAVGQFFRIYEFEIDAEGVFPMASSPYQPVMGTTTGSFGTIPDGQGVPILYIPDISNSVIYRISLDRKIPLQNFAGIIPETKNSSDALSTILDRPQDIAVSKDNRIFFFNRGLREILELDSGVLAPFLIREISPEKYLRAGLGYRAFDDSLIFSWSDPFTKLYRFRLDGSDGTIELIKSSGATADLAQPVPDGSLAIESEFNRIRALSISMNGNIFINTHKAHVTEESPEIPTMRLFKIMPCASILSEFYSNEACSATMSDEDATVWQISGSGGEVLFPGPTAKESGIFAMDKSKMVVDNDGTVFLADGVSIYKIDDNMLLEVYSASHPVLHMALWEKTSVNPEERKKIIYYLTEEYVLNNIDGTYSQPIQRYQIYALDLADPVGTPVTVIGAHLNRPSFMTVDNQGNILVSDTGSNRILRFHIY